MIGNLLHPPIITLTNFRVKLATSRDASLVRLPPSEAALRQHILRALFQTKVWHSCLAKPPLPSPMELRMANCQGFFASSLL